MTKTVLNIGCGTTPLNSQTAQYIGWKEIRVDSYDNPTADLKSDIRDLKEIEDGSVDSVWACHVVEHCYFHDLPKVFGSIMRVLNDDGYAVIRVPDLGSIAKLIEESILEPVYQSECGPICPLDMIYGHRAQVADFPGMEHKTGFTVTSMSQILGSLEIKGLINGINHDVIAVLYKNEPPYEALNKEGFIL